MDNEQLKRIADAIEEILRLVKKDQESAAARQRQNDSEQTTRASNGPSILATLAMAQGSGPKLQATSFKLQAPSFRVDKIKL